MNVSSACQSRHGLYCIVCLENDLVDLGGRRVVGEGEADSGLGKLAGVAHGGEDVGGFVRAGGTGGAAAAQDAAFFELEEDGFAAGAGKAEAGVVG